MDNFMITCDHCEATTRLTPESLLESQVTIEGKELTITKFRCEQCRAETLVQIDDEETKAALFNYKQMAVTRTYKRNHGSDVTQKYLKRMSQLQKELDIKRQDLKTQYWESVTCLLTEKTTGHSN